MRSTKIDSPVTPAQCLALAWFYHRRFEFLTPPLGIRRFVLSTKARKPLREIILAVRTVALLLRERPRVVLVQNPSAVCTLLIALLRPLFGYQFIVDAHGDAVIPYAHNNVLVRAVSFQLLKRAYLTIVTNEGLGARVRSHGGRPVVLFDNLPHVPAAAISALGPGKHIMFISTYAADEPHAEVFNAATALKDVQVTFHVTGRINTEKLARLPPVPSNVKLTGFLSEEDYWSLLKASDVVIDLTTMPDCLVCGAYEAVGAGRALVLSDNGPSRELFADAALYTQNTATSIEQTVRRALAEQASLEGKSKARAMWLRSAWDSRAAALSTLIANAFGQ